MGLMILEDCLMIFVFFQDIDLIYVFLEINGYSNMVWSV